MAYPLLPAPRLGAYGHSIGRKGSTSPTRTRAFSIPGHQELSQPRPATRHPGISRVHRTSRPTGDLAPTRVARIPPAGRAKRLDRAYPNTAAVRHQARGFRAGTASAAGATLRTRSEIEYPTSGALVAPLHHELLDLSNCLRRVEILRTGFGAIHNRVAAIQAERIFQHIQSLTRGLVT